MKITQRSLDFTRQDTVKSLDNFDQNGRVYRSKLLVLSEDLKPEQAADCLERGESIFIALKDGAAHRIDTSSNLQRLDSLKGLNLKPSVLPVTDRPIGSTRDRVMGSTLFGRRMLSRLFDSSKTPALSCGGR